MDLTFISLLRVLSKTGIVSGPNNHGACIDYASQPSVAIERGCSVGANHAQNRQLTSSDLTTRVAIAAHAARAHTARAIMMRHDRSMQRSAVQE
jgi:hypothetical protein